MLLSDWLTTWHSHYTENTVKFPANTSRQQCHHSKRTGWSWAKAPSYTTIPGPVFLFFFSTFQSKTFLHWTKSFYKYIGIYPHCLNELRMDQFWQTDALVTGESPAGGRSVSGCHCVCGWPGPSPQAVHWHGPPYSRCRALTPVWTPEEHLWGRKDNMFQQIRLCRNLTIIITALFSVLNLSDSANTFTGT